MSNINKIKVSGQTYNIEDVNASKTVELTQAQYDALTVKDPNTFYIITDATGGDLSNYYTKSETSGATEISTALNAKQDTLVSGTNIKTINNESLLGSGNIDIQGGGKAVSGGTNISITTGATADTINCTLNAKNGTGAGSIIFGNTTNVSNQQFSVAFGSGTQAKGIASIAEGEITQTTAWYCHSSGYKTLASGKWSNAEGYQTTASTQYSHTEGIGTKVTNNGEHSQGMYNTSSSDGTTSGNTLFSVGNGTANNARHNAFEIRQNGDIYITKDGADVKLQDQLGGGGGTSYTAGDGIDITNDVISVTGKVDTSAITTSITSSSTDAQVPSAKAVYDTIGNINTILESI